ncbi:MAG: VIT1/CCC1 transporter family protein [Archaeoglobales archaeon]|nr:VIT1/CCC1 transporter family protein [Archaeoglobales archaeon]
MRRKVDFLENLKLYSSLTDLSSISRRYFIIGFFDGVLTLVGLVIGSYLAGHLDSELIISSGIATGLALGISSGWGAYEAERVEQKIQKDMKEKALLTTFKYSTFDKAHKFAVVVSSFVHAVAPILAALIVLIPFVIFNEFEAFLTSLAVALSSLFIIGAFFGKIANLNVFFCGSRMMLAGIVTIIIVTLLSPSHLV